MSGSGDFWLLILGIAATISVLWLPIVAWRDDTTRRQNAERAEFKQKWHAEWEEKARKAAEATRPAARYPSVDDLLKLDPLQFEDAVADLLRATGYRDVSRIGGSGDRGVDILCTDPVGRPVAVQCKRYAPERKITSPDVQTFYGMVLHRRASRGIYVTTSSFTSNAVALAADLDLDLVDGPGLVRLFGGVPVSEPQTSSQRAQIGTSSTNPTQNSQQRSLPVDVMAYGPPPAQPLTNSPAIRAENRKLPARESIGEIPYQDVDEDEFKARLERLFHDDPERVEWELKRFKARNSTSLKHTFR